MFTVIITCLKTEKELSTIVLIGRTDSPNTPQLADILPKHCWFHFFSLTYPQRFLEQKCDLCAHVAPAKPWVNDLLLSSYNS